MALSSFKKKRNLLSAEMDILLLLEWRSYYYPWKGRSLLSGPSQGPRKGCSFSRGGGPLCAEKRVRGVLGFCSIFLFSVFFPNSFVPPVDASPLRSDRDTGFGKGKFEKVFFSLLR